MTLPGTIRISIIFVRYRFLSVRVYQEEFMMVLMLEQSRLVLGSLFPLIPLDEVGL